MLLLYLLQGLYIGNELQNKVAAVEVNRASQQPSTPTNDQQDHHSHKKSVPLQVRSHGHSPVLFYMLQDDGALTMPSMQVSSQPVLSVVSHKYLYNFFSSVWQPPRLV